MELCATEEEMLQTYRTEYIPLQSVTTPPPSTAATTQHSAIPSQHLVRPPQQLAPEMNFNPDKRRSEHFLQEFGNDIVDFAIGE